MLKSDTFAEQTAIFLTSELNYIINFDTNARLILLLLNNL